jgi:Xaa-Pro dipeptidase
VYFLPRDYWHPVPGAPQGYWTEEFDIRVVHDLDSVAQHLPADRGDCVLIGEIDDPAHAFGIERLNPAAVLDSLHFARSVKTAYELSCLRAASRRAANGHRAAAAAFRDGAGELDIHRAFCRAVGHTDNELPYPNIVALNEHGAVLHYTNLDRDPPPEIRSFLIDAGAQVNGYAADVTRTYSFADGRFAGLIDRVDAAQLAIVDRVGAGVDFVELHVQAHRLLGQALIDTGIAQGDADALLDTGVTAAFFPHGLGHLLGLQVHDVAGFMVDESGAAMPPPAEHPFLRLTRRLEEDMVLTIEPGVYAIDLLLDPLHGSAGGKLVDWDAVARLRSFGGIRVEDNVRVTAGKPENLTRDAFARTA